VKFSEQQADGAGAAPPPTAVLVHGIMGSRRNLLSFAKLLARRLPAWQFLLVDLRCHGASAAGAGQSAAAPPPHTTASAAADVLRLLRELRLFPNVLIGHSFGGKVVLSMVEQFGGRALPRPVQVWVLDTLPSAGVHGSRNDDDGADHPGRLIKTLRQIPMPTPSRGHVVDALVQKHGFTVDVANWVVTNMRTAEAGEVGGRAVGGELRWSFDLSGIDALYDSYEATDLWRVVEHPPQGLDLNFVRAERSTFRWGGGAEEKITALGSRVHLLRQAGHWVHSDNPEGLGDIIVNNITDVTDAPGVQYSAAR